MTNYPSHYPHLSKQRKLKLKKKRFFEKLKHKLLNKLDDWKNFKPIRGKIEDFFKLLKQGLNLREIHKYTPKSVEKNSIFKCIFRSLNYIRRV